MPAPKYITICGKRWKFARPPKIVMDGEEQDGYCSNPKLPNKTIGVQSGLRDERELTIILHECLHAGAFNLLGEVYVETTSENLGNFLWEHGYRKVVEISRADRGKKSLIVNIHGILRASAQHVLDDKYVLGLSEDLGNILWRLGYRKVELEDDND